MSETRHPIQDFIDDLVTFADGPHTSTARRQEALRIARGLQAYADAGRAETGAEPHNVIGSLRAATRENPEALPPIVMDLDGLLAELYLTVGGPRWQHVATELLAALVGMARDERRRR